MHPRGPARTESCLQLPAVPVQLRCPTMPSTSCGPPACAPQVLTVHFNRAWAHAVLSRPYGVVLEFCFGVATPVGLLDNVRVNALQIACYKVGGCDGWVRAGRCMVAGSVGVGSCPPAGGWAGILMRLRRCLLHSSCEGPSVSRLPAGLPPTQPPIHSVTLPSRGCCTEWRGCRAPTPSCWTSSSRSPVRCWPRRHAPVVLSAAC